MKKLYAKIVLRLIRPALEADREVRMEEALMDLGPSPERTKVLNQLHGLGVNSARYVLSQAESMLNATTTLNCKAAEFQQAVEEHRSALEQKSHPISAGGRVRSAEDEAIWAEALQDFRTRSQGNPEEYMKDLAIELRRPLHRRRPAAVAQQTQSPCEKSRDQERPAHQECAPAHQMPPAAPERDQQGSE